MPTLPRPRGLVGWIRLWCERPGMFLVARPERQTWNIDVLWALITGYELALEQLGRPSEHAAFREFVHARRPDLWSSDWYGGALLARNGDGDHLRVVEQIRRWADDFEKSRAG